MRIHHVVTRISDPANGCAYSVPPLCAALGRQGHDVALHVLGPGSMATPESYELEIYPESSSLGSFGFSKEMRSALRRHAPDSEILHNHGLWAMPNVYPAKAVRGTDCKLVFSPRGCMDPWPWRHHRVRKRLFWYAGQAASVRRAVCTHVTAELEYDSVRALGVTGPVAVIPNGVTLPELKDSVPTQGRRLLYLGRVHRKKGLDVLLRAWNECHRRYPDWHLDVVGPDDGGFAGQMQELMASLDLPRVTFVGRVSEEEKWRRFAQSELYVLPTHGDNWANTVTQALSSGTPAIVSKGAPWQGLEQNGCGWWIDLSVDSLVHTLDDALSLPAEELSRRGARGRDWVDREFGWERIGGMMEEVYTWLLTGGTPPDCVVVD